MYGVSRPSETDAPPRCASSTRSASKSRARSGPSTVRTPRIASSHSCVSCGSGSFLMNAPFRTCGESLAIGLSRLLIRSGPKDGADRSKQKDRAEDGDRREGLAEEHEGERRCKDRL